MGELKEDGMTIRGLKAIAHAVIHMCLPLQDIRF